MIFKRVVPEEHYLFRAPRSKKWNLRTQF